MSASAGQKLPYGMTSNELETFFNLSPDLFCIISDEMFLKYLNPAWESALGWTHEELLGKTIKSLIHPDDAGEAMGELEALKEKLSGGFQARFRHSNGSFRWLEWRLTFWRESNNIYGVARDITKRKQMEDVVADSLRLFEKTKIAVMRGTPDAKRFEFVNAAFAQMHGYTVEEMIGRPILDIIAPEYRAEFPEHVNMASQRGYYTFKAIHIRKDGSTFPAHKEVVIIKDAKGGIRFRFCFVHDLSQPADANRCCA